MEDHVRRDLDIPVKSLQRVIRRRVAKSVLDIRHVPDAGFEVCREAVDRRRQRRHIALDPGRPCELLQNAAAFLVLLEVWEISLQIIDRLISVLNANPVHILEQLVVDLMENLHGCPHLAEVQIRILLFKLLNRRVPLVKRHPPAPFDTRMLLEIVPVEFRLAQPLHRIALGYQIPLPYLPVESQRPDPVLLLHEVILPLALVFVYGPEILVDKSIGLFFRDLSLPRDIPDVPLHRLALVLDPHNLVDPLDGLCFRQRLLGKVPQPLLALRVPCLELQRQHIIVSLCLVDLQDLLPVFHPCHIIRACLPAQQPVHDLLVGFRQQRLALRFLDHSPCILQLRPHLLRFFRCLRNSKLFFGLVLRVQIPLRHAQPARQPVDGFREIRLLPLLEARRLRPVVFIQRLLHLLNAARHIVDLHQLVARRGNVCREQLRRHFPKLLIRHIHRQAVLADRQRPHGRLPEQIVVRNILPVCLGDRDLLIPDELLEVAVLLDVLRIFLDACLIGRFKEKIQLRPVKLPVRKERPQCFLGHRPQNLPLRLPRHAQILRQFVYHPAFQPPYILRRLLPHQIPIPPVLRRIPDIRVR